MVYVMLVDGFEEIEAFAPIDILRRANIAVQAVGVAGRTVTSSHGIKLIADCEPNEVQLRSMEMIVLPGGPGTKKLAESDFVRNALEFCVAHERCIAAICAAPSLVLGQMGLLRGKKATCYPGMETGMLGAIAQDEPVCIDDKMITARSAGAAIDFSLALCRILRDDGAAEEVRSKIYYDER